LCRASLTEPDRIGILVRACGLRDGFSLLHRFGPAPVMRRRVHAAIATVGKREEKQIGLAVLGIAATAGLHDTNEA
jgi:hypothetical protein